MKSLFHSFAFFHREHGAITVEFTYDECGKPDEINVQMLGQTHTINNQLGGDKPCVTHCVDIVRHFLGTKPKSNQEKTRRRNVKRKLFNTDGLRIAR